MRLPLTNMGRDGVVDAVQESFDAIQEAREGLTLICSTLSAEVSAIRVSCSQLSNSEIVIIS